jgi:hypothetical protein
MGCTLRSSLSGIEGWENDFLMKNECIRQNYKELLGYVGKSGDFNLILLLLFFLSFPYILFLYRKSYIKDSMALGGNTFFRDNIHN